MLETTPLFLDVRRQAEYDICRIDGSVLIPLDELPNRLGELDAGKEIVVHCHHGGRSRRAAAMMMQAGFENVYNLAGGIDAWSLEIDSGVPRY